MIHFEPRNATSHIIVVGLGGTGSQLARSIARIVFDMERSGLRTPSILFVDPDRIEDKNVGRQMFTGADCGQFKAELLARRFNAAMGLDIRWSCKEFDPAEHATGYGTLVVGCVDNHVARQALARAQVNVWLDCGNHTDSGQVICGSTDDRAAVRRELRRCKKYADHEIDKLPNAAAVFPELLEPPDPTAQTNSDASCAELVEMGVQHLLINDAIATAAAAYVFRLLYRKPLHSFMTFVSLDAVRPIAITPENLQAYAGITL